MKRFLLTAFCLNICVIFIFINDSFDINVLYNYQKGSTKNCVVNTLSNTLVVVNFNYPRYDTMEILQELYDGVFGRIISCGAIASHMPTSDRQPDLVVPRNPAWFFRYQCLAMGIEKYPDFKGEKKVFGSNNC